MKQYTEEELVKIFTGIAPPAGLLVPLPSGPTPSSRAPGPAVCVFLRYSEIAPGTADVESHYWNTLRQTPVISGIGVLASINSILSEHRANDANLHHVLNGRFLTADLAAKVAANNVTAPGFAGVFTRIGCLQLMRHLLLYGKGSLKLLGQNEKTLGELVLLKRVPAVRSGSKTGAADDAGTAVVFRSSLGRSQSA